MVCDLGRSCPGGGSGSGAGLAIALAGGLATSGAWGNEATDASRGVGDEWSWGQAGPTRESTRAPIRGRASRLLHMGHSSRAVDDGSMNNLPSEGRSNEFL